MTRRHEGVALQVMLMVVVVADCLLEQGNLVLNGGFEDGRFKRTATEAVEISEHPKNNPAIPSWVVTNRSVQVINSNMTGFNPPPASHFSYLYVHLNTKRGNAGTIRSAPLLGQYLGVRYRLKFDIAGHRKSLVPLYKGMQVRIKSRRGVLLWWLFRVLEFDVFASNPFNVLVWVPKVITYVSTGMETRIELASKTDGPYGLLVDNFRVEPVNILDNGSFELVSDRNFTGFDSDILTAPFSTIKGWVVESGNIKYISGRFMPASDGSPSSIDLNGNAPGVLTCGLSTTPKTSYVMVFDCAVNPEAGSRIKGYLSSSIYSGNNNETILLSKWDIWVTSAAHPSWFEVGWKTSKVEFQATSNYTYIKFQSSIKGDYGPLLDNVRVMKLEDPYAAASVIVVSSALHILVSLLWVLLFVG